MYTVYINGKLASRGFNKPTHPLGTTKIGGLTITVYRETRCPACNQTVPPNEMACYGSHEDCRVNAWLRGGMGRSVKLEKESRKKAHTSRA